MPTPGLKATVKLESGSSGAKLVDSATGRSLALSVMEAKVLALWDGTSDVAQLTQAAKSTGMSIEVHQVSVLMTRLNKAGFLASVPPSAAKPPKEQAPPELELETDADLVPRLRDDLVIERSPQSKGVLQVKDPKSERTFTLYDFEVSIARMLDGKRTAAGVMEAAGKIGITVTLDSLKKFIKQMRAYRFVDEQALAAGASTTWPKRAKWDPQVRELFQGAIRLSRHGKAEEALTYLDALEEVDPKNEEAAELRAHVEEQLQGGAPFEMDFDELHGDDVDPHALGSPAASLLSPPPQPSPFASPPGLPVPSTGKGPVASPPSKAPVASPPVKPAAAGAPLAVPAASPPWKPSGLGALGAASSGASASSLLGATKDAGAPAASVFGLGATTDAGASAPATKLPGATKDAGSAALATSLLGATQDAGSSAPATSLLATTDDGAAAPATSLLGAPQDAGSSAPATSMPDSAKDAGAGVPAISLLAGYARGAGAPRAGASAPSLLGADALRELGPEALTNPAGGEPAISLLDLSRSPRPIPPSSHEDPMNDDPKSEVDSTDAAQEFFRSGEFQVPPGEPTAATEAYDGEAEVPKKGKGGLIAALVLLVALGGTAAAMLRPVPWIAKGTAILEPKLLGTPKAPRAGAVKELAVQDGAEVKAGDVLATLDAEPAKRQVAMLEAQRDQAKKLATQKTDPKEAKLAQKAKKEVAKAKKEVDALEAQKAKAGKNAKKNAKALASIEKLLKAKQAALEKAQGELDGLSREKSRAEAAQKVKELDAQIATAKAQLDQNTVTAPVAGWFLKPQGAAGLDLAAGADFGRIVAKTATVKSPGPFADGGKAAEAQVEVGGKKLKVREVSFPAAGSSRGLTGTVDVTSPTQLAASVPLEVQLGTRPFYKQLLGDK